MKWTDFWKQEIELRKAIIDEIKGWMREKGLGGFNLPTDDDVLEDYNLNTSDIPTYHDINEDGEPIMIRPKTIYLHKENELCATFINEDGEKWEYYSLEKNIGSLDEILATHDFIYKVLKSDYEEKEKEN